MPSLDSAAVPDSTDWLPTPLAALAPLESALRCQVCKDFFNTPVITSCSHTFCSLCIRRYLSQEGRCPACRSADQELKLRRNWVVEELVTGFVEGRERLLTFARRSAEVERQKQEDEEESLRPKKRRKVQAPRAPDVGAGAERRSTRIQIRRNAMQASQESAEEHVVADSDDAGSQYEDEADTQVTRRATSPLRAQAEPTDGLVACPGCGKRMKEEVVFTHLDRCESSGGGQDTPPTTNGVHSTRPPPARPSIAYTAPDALPTGKSPDRLPTLAYSMLSETALRKKLQALGISSQGPKPLLQKRHTEWVNLWNANCDSRHPRKKRDLLNELDVWERTQGRQILQGMSGAAGGGGQGTGVMAKDFDGEGWMRGNKSDFEDLVRRAREKKARPPSRPDADQQTAETESKPKTSVQEISRNAAHASADNANGTSTLQPNPPATTDLQHSTTTSRSPFFDIDVDNDNASDRQRHQHDALTEQSTEPPSPMNVKTTVDLMLPAKPSMELEREQSQSQSQSQGSQLNGLFA